jgi:flavin reductase (DIM6/NTAB) family NADH-FMN oxidoreductase RutF
MNDVRVDGTGDVTGLSPVFPGRHLRAMMRAFPTGVAVVTTTESNGSPRGMTCSSVVSVSLDPPTLLVCIRRNSPTLHAIVVAGQFAVNLLHEDGKGTAELFASGGPDRFDRVGWRLVPGGGGPHLLDAAHAVADCRLGRTLTVGDHVVVLGDVFKVTNGHECKPLLYGMGRYAAWPTR